MAVVREVAAPAATVALVRKVCKCLLKAFSEVFAGSLVSLVLFGSYARFEAKCGSDIDVLLVLDKVSDDRFELHRKLDEVEVRLQPLYGELKSMGYTPVLSPIVLDKETAAPSRPIYLDMVDDGIVIYDKDDFFTSTLKRLKVRLGELDAKRVRVGEKWVWILKRDYRFGEVIEI
ncbi:MAG: nucleotidyltransferase domain-containing protein [Nitrososphaeria archaeon]